ncbi:MAG: hypothetical protein AAFR16_09495, partial [Pseudomonadota bacterium]
MRTTLLVAGACVAALSAGAAQAEPISVLGYEVDLRGSLREGGFSRYTPTINNPLFNETPLITTEAKPFYAYHDVPDDFISQGGNIQVAALQLRLAFSERFGFIATTDGFTSADFNAVLTDDSGPNDVAFGVKYAAYYAPERGEIATVGLRYTAPAGNVETGTGNGGLDIPLNGVGAGFLNPFVTALKIYDDGPLTGLQLQGSAGAQIGISDDSYSFFHGSATASYEALPGFYPTLESHVFAPFDGADRGAPFDGALSNLTGAEFLDVGGSDPQTIVLLGGGFRWRPLQSENAIFGFGAVANVA